MDTVTAPDSGQVTEMVARSATPPSMTGSSVTSAEAECFGLVADTDALVGVIVTVVVVPSSAKGMGDAASLVELDADAAVFQATDAGAVAVASPWCRLVAVWSR